MGDPMRWNRDKNRLIVLRLTVMLLAGFAVLFDMRCRPFLYGCAQSQAELLITDTINQAFEAAMAEQAEGISFADLRYGANGEVKSLTLNNTTLNELKADFVDHYIACSEDTVKFSMTIGTLTGISFLNCLGPFVTFFAELSHYPDARFDSTFVSQGINQTLHRVVFHVRVEISYIYPGGSDSVPLETEYVVSESLIVGKVPDSYTNILQNGRSLLDTAEDAKIYSGS